MFDAVLSRAVSSIAGAKNKECWSNGIMAVAVLLSLDKEAEYVEGWVITSFGFVVEHGWAEVGGTVVDCTPAYIETPAIAYFPAVRFSLDEVRAIETGTDLPLVHNDGGYGWSTPAYREAYVRATRQAYGGAAEMILTNIIKAYPELKEVV